MKSPEKFKNVYMEQTSPNNPFGPNYFGTPYQVKVGYKFSKMKGYIKPTRQDLLRKQDEQSRFLGMLLMGVAAGPLIGGAFRMIAKRATPKFYEILNVYQNIYYPVLIALSTGKAYFIANDRYYKEVSEHFLNKYLKQAIQNGFEDYQISK